MDKGIYTALSGGIAKSHEIELIANNLANATTPGFKRDTGTFNEYLTELRKPDSVEGLKREITAASLLDGRPTGDKSFVEMDAIYTDHRQGVLTRTGRSLDVAIQGNGFFEVNAPSGLQYTRQGNLNVSAEGVLVTGNGFPVLAQLNPEAPSVPGGRSIASQHVPPEARYILVKDGPIQVTEDGSVMQNGERLGRLSIQEFHESQWLEKVGNSYFRNTHQDNLKDGMLSRVHQGSLESSNVNAVGEMTRLIEAHRAYESHMQAIKTYQEIDNRTVNDIARG